jgi:hypothetical protein
MFKFLSKVVKGANGGIVASLEGITDISTTLIKAVKRITVDTLSETGDFLKEGIQVPAAIVKGVMAGLGELGVSVAKAVKGVVRGTIEGAKDSGIKQEHVVRGTVAETLYSAKELGIDIGETAVSSVQGVIEGVTTIGGDTAKATFTAIKTVLTVAQEFGDETLGQVKSALTESVQGAKNIIEEIEK